MTSPVHIDFYEAQASFEELVERVVAGEEIVIAKDGVPVVKILPVPPSEPKPPRVGGQWRGKIWIADDFDAPDPELESLFYDGPVFPEHDEDDEK